MFHNPPKRRRRRSRRRRRRRARRRRRRRRWREGGERERDLHDCRAAWKNAKFNSQMCATLFLST